MSIPHIPRSRVSTTQISTSQVFNSRLSTLIDSDLMRGLRGRCPCCGKGRLFRAFLKVSDQCRECGEELHHHRADDFPAYCVIFIVGHVIVPLVVSVEMAFAPPYWIHFALWLPATLFMSLGLLQPVKGFIVALQWRLGMHGFEDAKQARAIARAHSVFRRSGDRLAAENSVMHQM